MQSERKYERYHFVELIFIFAGLSSGMAFSFYMMKVWPASLNAVEKARELGIVSITILTNYPKQVEVAYYLLFLTFTFLMGFLFWTIYRYIITKGNWTESDDHSFNESRSFPRWLYLVSALIALYLVYYASFFSTYWISEWYLLGEQGENLAWARRLMNGGVLYRDSFCLYGPLMQYPLAFLMDILGPSLYTARLYAWITYALSAVIIATVPFAVIKRPLNAAMLALMMLAFYFPVKLSVNATPLRIYLGILSLYLIFMYYDKKDLKLLLLAGLVSGFTFAYSQENGLAVLMTVSFFFFMACVVRRDLLRLKEAGLFIIGFGVAVSPFVVYFSANDALIPFLKTLYVYPRYVMLGYAAVPAPDIIARITAYLAGELPLAKLAFPTAFVLPPIAYALSLLFIVIELLKGRMKSRDLFFFMIAIYGVITFRSALGRSDGFHLLQVWGPAFFSFAYLSLLPFREGKRPQRIKATIFFIITFTIPLLIVLGSFNAKPFKQMFAVNLLDFSQKFSPKVPARFKEVKSPETEGIYMPPGAARTTRELLDFKKKLKLADRVYVFGNTPYFYFMLDKLNPVRYDYPYWAVTTAMQQEIVDGLADKARPDYILYKLDRIDMIDGVEPHMQVPLIYRFIKENYRRDSRFNYKGFTVYRPKRGRFEAN